MPTSVPGCSDRRVRRPLGRQSGFSLIELLVVIAIIGIATAAVGLAAFPPNVSALRRDADRLVQLFAVAQAEARAGGRPIVWEPREQDYRFRRRADWRPNSAHDAITQAMPDDLFERDQALRPRAWEAGSVQVTLGPARAAVFNSEWIADPLRIQLSDGSRQIAIVRDATGRYEVQQ